MTEQELDQLLFGHDLASSRVAHYSDVRWPPAGAIAGRQPAEPASSRRAARERAVHLPEHPQVSPKAAAAAIVMAAAAPRAPGAAAARGGIASDVIDYLYGGFKERRQAPVRQALLSGPQPRVIVAHSLGTIILYDVLSEPVFAGFDVHAARDGRFSARDRQHPESAP